MNGKKIVLVSASIMVAVGAFLFLNKAGTITNSSARENQVASSEIDRGVVAIADAKVDQKSNANQSLNVEVSNITGLLEDQGLDHDVNLTSELKSRMSAIQQRRPDLSLSANDVALAVAKENAWQQAKTIPQNLPLSAEEFTDGRQFIKFDSIKLETLMPGDNLKIDGVDGFGDYDVIIDRVIQHNPESISWYGHIDNGDGETYDVNFTRGKFLTVGGINTPEGHYALQAHGDDGWIASSALLFKVDENHTDEMYPEED